MRVDADDFARPCSCGREHQIAVKEILIEAGAVEKLEEEMSEGMLKEYISPLVICDTNTYAATEEIMEDIYDRCQVLVLDAEGLLADRKARCRKRPDMGTGVCIQNCNSSPVLGYTGRSFFLCNFSYSLNLRADLRNKPPQPAEDDSYARRGSVEAERRTGSDEIPLLHKYKP